MSNSKEKVQQSGAECLAHCDICKEEDLTENVVAFCARYWKYLCSACLTYHGKFLPGHKLKTGKVMPIRNAVTSHFQCEIHTNYAIEHGSVFCRFCKSLKHDSCDVRIIEDILKEINVKEEVNAIFASLSEVTLILVKQEDETRTKLMDFSIAKSVIKTKVKRVKKELVEILNSYKTILDDQQESDIESLNAKM